MNALISLYMVVVLEYTLYMGEALLKSKPLHRFIPLSVDILFAVFLLWCHFSSHLLSALNIWNANGAQVNVFTDQTY